MCTSVAPGRKLFAVRAVAVYVVRRRVVAMFVAVLVAVLFAVLVACY